MIQLDALQTIDRTNKLCWCRFELLLPILCYLTICPDFIFLLFTCCFNSSKLNLNFIWRWCWWIDVSIKKLEKLEAAKVAYLLLPFVTFCYLLLPFVTFPYLSLPFLTFPYLSLPFLSLTGPYIALLDLTKSY